MNVALPLIADRRTKLITMTNNRTTNIHGTHIRTTVDRPRKEKKMRTKVYQFQMLLNYSTWTMYLITQNAIHKWP